MMMEASIAEHKAKIDEAIEAYKKAKGHKKRRPMEICAQARPRARRVRKTPETRSAVKTTRPESHGCVLCWEGKWEDQEKR